MNLHQAVEVFAKHILQAEKCSGTTIQLINGVPATLHIAAGQEILYQTLQHLLLLKADDSNSYISIGAKLFNQLILVQLKTNLCFDYLTNEYRFREINEMAGKLGGCLYISQDRKDEVVISYTYINKVRTGEEKNPAESFSITDCNSFKLVSPGSSVTRKGIQTTRH